MASFARIGYPVRDEMWFGLRYWLEDESSFVDEGPEPGSSRRVSLEIQRNKTQNSLMKKKSFDIRMQPGIVLLVLEGQQPSTKSKFLVVSLRR